MYEKDVDKNKSNPINDRDSFIESAGDPFFISLYNPTGTNQQVTLFDRTDSASNGAVQTYVYSFPQFSTADTSSGSIVINGVTTNFTGGTTPAQIATNISNITYGGQQIDSCTTYNSGGYTYFEIQATSGDFVYGNLNLVILS